MPILNFGKVCAPYVFPWQGFSVPICIIKGLDTVFSVVSFPFRSYTLDQLEELFSVYGQIVQKNLLKDKVTGLPRGVGFVRYDDDYILVPSFS